VQSPIRDGAELARTVESLPGAAPAYDVVLDDLKASREKLLQLCEGPEKIWPSSGRFWSMPAGGTGRTRDAMPRELNIIQTSVSGNAYTYLWACAICDENETCQKDKEGHSRWLVGKRMERIQSRSW
jgi:hypothetical protein